MQFSSTSVLALVLQVLLYLCTIMHIYIFAGFCNRKFFSCILPGGGALQLKILHRCHQLKVIILENYSKCHDLNVKDEFASLHLYGF